ncbi:hypothetical protein ACJX0J_030327, partial [Zea mays]
MSTRHTKSAPFLALATCTYHISRVIAVAATYRETDLTKHNYMRHLFGWEQIKLSIIVTCLDIHRGSMRDFDICHQQETSLEDNGAVQSLPIKYSPIDTNLIDKILEIMISAVIFIWVKFLINVKTY